MPNLSDEVAKLQGAIASLAHKAKASELLLLDNKKKEQIIQQLNQKLSQHVKDKETAAKIIEGMNTRLNAKIDRVNQLEQALREARAQIPEAFTPEGQDGIPGPNPLVKQTEEAVSHT